MKFEGFSDVFEQEIENFPPAAGFFGFLRNFTFNPILHFIFEILGIQGGRKGEPRIIRAIPVNNTPLSKNTPPLKCPKYFLRGGILKYSKKVKNTVF